MVPGFLSTEISDKAAVGHNAFHMNHVVPLC